MVSAGTCKIIDFLCQDRQNASVDSIWMGILTLALRVSVAD